MAAKNDVTAPVSVTIASVSTLVGNAIIQNAMFDYSPRQYLGFLVGTVPGVLLLVVLAVAVTVLIVRLVQHGRAAVLRQRKAYLWLLGSLVVLGFCALIAFTGLDPHGAWVVGAIFLLPQTLLVSAAVGVIALFLLSNVIGVGRPPGPREITPPSEVGVEPRTTTT